MVMINRWNGYNDVFIVWNSPFNCLIRQGNDYEVDTPPTQQGYLVWIYFLQLAQTMSNIRHSIDLSEVRHLISISCL